MVSRYRDPEADRVDRQINMFERRLAAIESGAGLSFSSIGRQGLRVHSGGRIFVQDLSGNTTLSLASSLLELEGLLRVTGEIRVIAGVDNRTIRLVNGQIFVASGMPGEQAGSFYASDEDDRPAMQIAPPFLEGAAGDNRITIEGSSPSLPGGAFFIITGGDGVFDVEETIFLSAKSGNITARLNNTTSAANMHIDGTDASASWLFYRVTSNAASKVDVADFDVPPEEVLNLKPRTWRDKEEVKKDPDTTRWHVGFIAEELEAAGLGAFVDYDEDDNPVSITYDRLTAALLVVLKDQNRRLAELEARVAALDNKSPTRPARKKTQKPKRKPCKTSKLEPADPPGRGNRVREQGSGSESGQAD